MDGRWKHLLDDRKTVVVLVEDLLGGVKSWSMRLGKAIHDHPEYNVIMVECPVFAKEVKHTYDVAAPTLEELEEILEALHPDIVIPNYAWEAFALCAKLLDRGATMRTIGFCRTDEELYYQPLTWFEPIIAEFICVSPECAAVLGERIPHRKHDIHVLPSGIIVPPTLERNYQTTPIRVVYGGRMSQVQKRVLDFVPLVEELLKRRVDFHLDLVGEGSQTEKLKKAMDALPHENRVDFHDAVPPGDMLEIWKNHEIFVQTSEYEGTSNSLLESLAFGTVPVVTAASSGINHVVREGENGFVVPVGDMKAMAKRIEELAGAPERLETLGAAAYESSKAFSIERYVNRFTTILTKSLGQEVRTWPHDELISPGITQHIRKLRRRSGGRDSLDHFTRRTKPAIRKTIVGAARPLAGSPTTPVTLVVAADNNFVLPLAVTVRSVLDNLGQDRRLNLYVVDGGITKENWIRLRRSWEDPRLTVKPCQADLDVLREMNVRGHVNALTYCRLLIPTLLPPHCEKAIYLDSDLLVVNDLGRLWDMDIEEHHLLAVQDATAPFMDSREVVPNFEASGPFMSAPVALANYRELGIDPQTPYFNAGVLVLNLSVWRFDGTARKIVHHLNVHKDSNRYWDQDGLNGLLHDKWALLDPRWNQIPHIYRYPNGESSPFGSETYDQIVNDPWIIHFAARSKPWHFDNIHPSRDLFFQYVDRTDWAGWRPAVPSNLLRNADFAQWEDAKLSEWERPLGGCFVSEEGPTSDILAVGVELDEAGKNAQLVQRFELDSSSSGKKLLAYVYGKTDEKEALGLNVYVTIDGKRKAYSRNHPGDGVWRQLSHEIELRYDGEIEAAEFMIVLRGHATRPVQVAAAFAGVDSELVRGLPSADGVAAASLKSKILDKFPMPVRLWLRSLRAKLGT